ncbi:hypothetical protein CDAR_229921 [Caerostris darwini]|uniref:Uncharacterized protein n=1 Tax=Caerostris darwini TaxID=1538125 RepID=A0AAV4PYJ5_9ARAC|nr:hypothetical protein CDAR_229921 [Caerostris darwini]
MSTIRYLTAVYENYLKGKHSVNTTCPEDLMQVTTVTRDIPTVARLSIHFFKVTQQIIKVVIRIGRSGRRIKARLRRKHRLPKSSFGRPTVLQSPFELPGVDETCHVSKPRGPRLLPFLPRLNRLLRSTWGRLNRCRSEKERFLE